MKPKSFVLLLFFCAFLFVLAGCAGKMSPDTAAKILSSELQIPEPQIKVETVSEVSGTVVADATLHLAFVLQKDESGQYRIVKVRYSDDRWETPEKLQKALPSSPFGRALHQAMVDSLDDPEP